MKKIKRIKLFVNNNEKSMNNAKIIQDKMESKGLLVNDTNYDLALSVGGDGSFLRMVYYNSFDNDILYAGINSGTLGFLQNSDMDNIDEFISSIANGNYKVEKIYIEETKVYTKNRIYKYNSINEVVIRKNNFNTVKFKVLIDDEYLEDYVGDGLLISTSTGSSAYNMSLGGSLIYGSLNVLELTPIAPVLNKVYKTFSSSIVIPASKVITIKPDANNNEIFLMVDGRCNRVKDVLKIEIKLSNRYINCLKMKDFHYIKVINDKILGNF